MTPKKGRRQSEIEAGAIPAEELKQAFPPIHLPIRPPFPPMEAKLVAEIPVGREWTYEPKWDGFRCLVFRKGDELLMQSKAGQPLARYFPELVQAFLALAAKQFVLDGEVVILRGHTLSFDDLLLRIHPAASRIKKLSEATPGSFFAFDILMDSRGKMLIKQPLRQRRQALEEFFAGLGQGQRQPLAARDRSGRVAAPSASPGPTRSIRLSPSSPEIKVAQRWMGEGSSTGLDGVVAKRTDMPYASGGRSAMQKIKRIRTADCVVGGFRYATKGKAIGSLLLGLYDERGLLDHIGFTSSFTAEQRREVKKVVEPLQGGEGFSGKAPGGPSRWSTERSGEWEPLRPKLVCEVRYDYFSGGRFRHGTKFLRWRPEKLPKQCSFDQVRGPAVEPDLAALGLV